MPFHKCLTILIVSLMPMMSVVKADSILLADEIDSIGEPELAIAEADKGYTLARTVTGEILLVLSADFEHVEAIDLSTRLEATGLDVIEAYNSIGESGLNQAVKDSSSGTYTWTSLGAPVNDRHPGIAAGTNFSKHAEEVGHEDGPFLFPKLSTMTPWNAAVHKGTRLDYEVELCAFPLSDYKGQKEISFGYTLCGDFTDRWLLVKDLKTRGEMGKTGFPSGKGGITHFPIGPLFLIPRDPELYTEIVISLYVNLDPRQHAPAGDMIWSPPQILANALDDCNSDYVLGNTTIRLAPCDGIPTGTPILTGTPDGVIFSLANLLLPWPYLGEGDVVLSFGTYLGLMKNTVTLQETQ
ncbi:hypothetical protein EY643_05355 [Halioglobus maricola]|uniref:Fumarylacetoacetase-like C-terminal domain-containing protein n=1 Tax=Halioglobus maricola TaxID=2601894 RepID=A0A5P9NH52_9GAMM|nr:fumarylacetoacetate hydrolase family protein [Halioglobus maricola]QFU75121.1 hypothetical protein EY643_05355 [Halioglobus maricola]